MGRGSTRWTSGALALALAGPARAAEPPTDELQDLALERVKKAAEHHASGRYHDAEEEFKRAAYFAPNWRGLHFNLGVVAEAQGKLGAAIAEYQRFRPLARDDEALVVDQRIDELTRRRAQIARVYHRQIAAGSVALAMCVGALTGAVLLLALGQAKHKRGEISDEKRAGMWAGGLILGIYGVLALGGAGLVLQRGVASKRKLDGLALGGARLHWAGLGAQLRF